jgi:hypothetical protein
MRRKRFFLAMVLCCHNLKVELLNGEQNKFRSNRWKSFLALALSCHNLKVDRKQKNYVLCNEKVNLALALCCHNLKVELLNGELDGEDEGGGEGDGHPPVADLDGEVGELGLQDGPLLLLPVLLAALRVLA